MTEVTLPPLVYRICPVGAMGMPAWGIELSNHTFGPELPMLFKKALEFMRDRQHTQLYWVLRINSPGGCVENVGAHPLLFISVNKLTWVVACGGRGYVRRWWCISSAVSYGSLHDARWAT